EKRCYEIERVMVAPPFQGRGYGKKLLEFAVAKLTQARQTPIALTVAACNHRAVNLYEAFGFTSVGEEVEEWQIEGHPHGC
ncbi:MAG: GNAT family N-acetyltransferase, partial [Oscillospiraceae bacterium]